MTFSNFNTISPNNPLNTAVSTPVLVIYAPRDPEPTDNSYQPGSSEWQNTMTGSMFKLLQTGASAKWFPFANSSSMGVQSVNAVSPDSTGNFTIEAGSNITITNAEPANGITISAATPTVSGITQITANDSTIATPVSGNVNVVGSGNITTTASGETLSASITGTIGVVNGGTGRNSFPFLNAVVFTGIPSSTSAFQAPVTGTAGTVLTSSGPTALPTWQSPMGFSSLNVQTFISNGTYTPTSGMTFCIVEVVGGGGAGGGAAPLSNGLSSGSGGGSGEYAQGIFNASTIGASQSVIIGAQGTGVSAASGGNGGNSSFGTLISAFGGNGGSVLSVNNSTFQTVTGGSGGSGGSGGNIRLSGSSGGLAQISGGNPNESVSGQGNGGKYSPIAAPVAIVNNMTSQSSNGISASGYGGGGGGSLTYVSTAASTGGNGSSGIVIITEYIS